MFNLKGFRTVAFNALFAGAYVFLAADPTAFVNSPEYVAYVALVQSIGNMVLRTMTNTPLGKKTT